MYFFFFRIVFDQCCTCFKFKKKKTFFFLFFSIRDTKICDVTISMLETFLFSRLSKILLIKFLLFIDNTPDSKFEENRSTGMRGSASRAPPQPLYRPGSGPLRKSGPSSDDFDNENNPQDKPKSSFFHNRGKHHQFNNPNQAPDNPPSSQIENISDKLNDMRLDYRNNSNEHNHPLSRNNQLQGGDPRKKNKKPEQQLYVPKKVKESLAGREVANR